MNDFELSDFDAFRVMPTMVGDVMNNEQGAPIVFMSYCEPEQATSWTVEGVYPQDKWVDKIPETEFICECLEQEMAYIIADFLNMLGKVKVHNVPSSNHN